MSLSLSLSLSLRLNLKLSLDTRYESKDFGDAAIETKADAEEEKEA